MSRGLGRDEIEREKWEDTAPVFETLSRSGADKRPRADASSEPKGFGENKRERVSIREREFRIRPSERRALADIGTFRVVAEEDLVSGVYWGKKDLAAADLRSLGRQGLIRSVTVLNRDEGSMRVHALTRTGRDVVLSGADHSGRVYHWDSVKFSEIAHDALLYRAYLLESGRIREEGGVVKRVVLDQEFKKEHFSRVNRSKAPYRSIQEESARELHLPVVDGHVMFPDFRVEFENERGDYARVDVEVATDNYRSKHLAQKSAAGFRVYVSGLQVHSSHGLKGNVFPREERAAFTL